MITLDEPRDSGEKQRIVRDILTALPEWFGIPSSVDNYVSAAGMLPLAVCRDGGKPIGFVTLSSPTVDACEIHSMGILIEWQHKGVGRRLVDWAVDQAVRGGKSLLVVKTLSPSARYEPYLATHRFYRSCGFREVGTYPEIWGESDPCLIMVRPC